MTNVTYRLTAKKPESVLSPTLVTEYGTSLLFTSSSPVIKGCCDLSTKKVKLMPGFTCSKVDSAQVRRDEAKMYTETDRQLAKFPAKRDRQFADDEQ